MTTRFRHGFVHLIVVPLLALTAALVAPGPTRSQGARPDTTRKAPTNWSGAQPPSAWSGGRPMSPGTSQGPPGSTQARTAPTAVVQPVPPEVIARVEGRPI